MTAWGRSVAAVTASASALLLTGAAMPQQDHNPDDTAAAFTQVLTDGGYDEVTCTVQDTSGDQVVVPAVPDGRTSFVIASLTADVGEDRPFSDLVFEPHEGDILSIVDAGGQPQTLLGAVVCAALTDSGQIEPDVVEGNMGGRGYAIAVDGVAELRPMDEPTAPVVETDVPAAPSIFAVADVGARVATAVALAWARANTAIRG